MTAVVFYFQAHQPYRLNPYAAADVGTGKPWFDDDVNREILRRVADRCYLPMNAVLKEQIEATEGRFRCAFSLSGTLLRQLADWAPDALDSFVDLAGTGAVEFLGETSHHSLAFLADPREFEAQVLGQAADVERLFGRRPTTFRNTELCISNDLAERVEELGFTALLGEGADRMLGWRSPHFVYRPRGTRRLKLLLRDYKLSDDVAFRFSNKQWPHHPLYASTYASWIHGIQEPADVVNLCMDYETFGEHQWAETGILEFMRWLPREVLANERFTFATPREVAASVPAVAEIDIPDVVSWADVGRNLDAWLGNEMQKAAHAALYDLGPAVRRAGAKDPALLEAWRRLTTSDHVYYMCTPKDSDGEVHEYFTPYESPRESSVRFTSVLEDLKTRLFGPSRPARAAPRRTEAKPAPAAPAPAAPPTSSPPRAKGAGKARPPRSGRRERP
jgi:alpha-amylase